MNKVLFFLTLLSCLSCKSKIQEKQSSNTIQVVQDNFDDSGYTKYSFVQNGSTTDYFIKESVRKKQPSIYDYAKLLPPMLYYQLPKKDNYYPQNYINEDVILQKDLQNGYIKVKAPNRDTTISETYGLKWYEVEIASFITQDKKDIIAFNILNSGKLLFLELKGNKWIDITTKIFPDLSCKTPPCGGEPTRFYKLPHYGTTILSLLDAAFILPPTASEFWKYQEKNSPDRLLKIAFDTKQGTFKALN